MSFRDTFSRASGSSENLPYDDMAAYHFYITVLLLVAIPLFYSMLKSILNPYSHIPMLPEIEKHAQFTKKIHKFKSDNRHNYLNCGFFFKLILLIAVLYATAVCLQQISQSKDQLQGFDPYQILEIEQDAPIEKIRKAYRRLALIYHPDRNHNSPEAKAKFIMISKAYECFTNDETKEKCLKYGNPQGSNSFSVGIALPSFLVREENQVKIMAIMFFLVVILLPCYLIYYHSQINKYNDIGMLMENNSIIIEELRQSLNFQECMFMVGCCRQFASLRLAKEQTVQLDLLIKQADQSIRTKYINKNYFNFIKKVITLIDAHINERKIAPELQKDYNFILRKVPLILKSATLTACDLSQEVYRNAGKPLGIQPILALIEFSQYFIQGKSRGTQQFLQLDITDDQFLKITKKRKDYKSIKITTLMYNDKERQLFLSLFEEKRQLQLKECIDYFPKVNLTCALEVEEGRTIAAKELFELSFRIIVNRKGCFSSSTSYPFLKKQSWYLIVMDGMYTIYSKNFIFEELETTFKCEYRKADKGKYSLSVHLVPDCYFGLDIRKTLKYNVGQAIKHKELEEEETGEEGESYFRKMMNSMSLPSDEDEESDKDEKEEKKNDEKSSD